MKLAFTALASAALLTSSFAKADPLVYNYDKNGTDWNFKDCNKSTSIQSPITVTHDGTDWYDGVSL